MMFKSCLTAVAAGAMLMVSGAETGLVGYWPLNEGEGVVIKDAGANQLDGKIIAPENAKWVAGRDGGKALEFGGVNGQAGYVYIPTLKKADFSQGMTVMCWALPSKAQKRNAIYDMVGNGRNKNGFLLMFHYQRLLLSGTGTSCERYANSTFGKNPIAYGSWMHVTGTHDGSGVFKVYIDGELAGTSIEKYSGPITPGLDALTIGSMFGYSPFLGAISEVKLYNRALSDAEILSAAQGE